MAWCKLLQKKRARRNAVGSRSAICAYHLMFLSMWHLFGLKPGKLAHLRCRQCAQQPDCSQKDVETGREKLITWGGFFPLICGLDLGELFLVDSRVKKKFRLCFKTAASIASTSRSAEEGGRFT